MTDLSAGTYELFLADDTVEFQGIYKKKKSLSSDTLKWLNFYYSLSESDRNAVSMIPSEFAGQISGNTLAVSETDTSASSYLEALTQEELDIVQRARNAHIGHHAPQSATHEEYLMATGFEALMGYLFLTGQMNRAQMLFRLGRV